MTEEKNPIKNIRRTTRSKTQFINFNKDEIRDLRMEVKNLGFKPEIDENPEIEVQKNIFVLGETVGLKNNIEKSRNANKIQHENVIEQKITFNNTPVEKSEPLTEKEQRTYSFKDLLDWVHKKEKRELYPKNKYDYSYKKNKSEFKNQNELLYEERNIVHMKIEEEIIPSLKNNPFIIADKYLRSKKNM